MLFHSGSFLIFFPIVSLVYFLVPRRAKHLWLLGASYYFYMSWNPEYALLILVSTVSTWGSALFLSARRQRPGKGRGRAGRWCLAGCVALNLGILFFFKYYGFAAESVRGLFALGHISLELPAFDVLLPVGISFYTFQAIGYLVDVWRGEVAAERNFLRYALFLSFFPQLVAGPIERSRNLLHQIHEPQRFDFGRAKDGLLLMGWGFFQKLVVADRIAVLVDGVYGDYTSHSGLQILLATVLFAFQIYCDFAGYSDIAIGAARVMGFALTKNFRSPYFATTVSGFWRDWHISLTTWFRDYVYIPLGGNRRGRARKYRNLLLTFGASGLWHGAGWNFVAWGLLNGLYQVAGDMTRTLRQRLGEPALLAPPAVARRQESRQDGTIKYLWRLADGNCVESPPAPGPCDLRAGGFRLALLPGGELCGGFGDAGAWDAQYRAVRVLQPGQPAGHPDHGAVGEGLLRHAAGGGRADAGGLREEARGGFQGGAGEAECVVSVDGLLRGHLHGSDFRGLWACV